MAVLVSKQAPDFTAQAVMGNNEIREFTLSKEISGKYASFSSIRSTSPSSARPN